MSDSIPSNPFSLSPRVAVSGGATASGSNSDVFGPVVIALEEITMRFRHQTVLEGINLQVRKGETLAVIGESGCGKTVLLKLMIGLLKPTKGRVRFEGRDLAGLSQRDLTQMRLRFGFLFQMAALFDSLTIFDNVAFGPREHRLMAPSELPGMVRERLREVGLPEGIEFKKPAELSGGQRKRVGLARALALNPEVLLYDEPTTGLDPVMSDVINELILQTQRAHHTTGIVVTHDMTTVRKVADRVVMLYPRARLKPGEAQMIYDGPPENLHDHSDPRVRQFVRGEAGERLRELSLARDDSVFASEISMPFRFQR
ncbi:ABC transporter related protein [Isosphaera pallida ATCC 43644]|uniref:ABC transporter related protein n=1 Tax=Isosphaera pallida (strain ATCC 43644 / DSM 9630 / IS1B) TaxID=575540 RepID=E8R0Y8_ISOPI|nr:ABC transporter ATP-binding protein [Isosphaera pallida]ADV62334.1 ABC transporter related protein [Isosphaera pallida ATCC 43644]